MCQVMDISRSGYYERRKETQSRRAQENQQLLQEVEKIFEKSRRTYGSPRMTVELRDMGYSCSRHRIARLMRRAGIQAKVKKRFRAKGHTGKRYVGIPDLVQRAFVAKNPNQLWVADITYIWSREGWAYLAAILDVYSRMIVGWSLGRHPTTNLTRQAFDRAIGQRQIEPGLIHHSDQGAQYANHIYQGLLRLKGIHGSMGDKGSCYDNAMMESFFHTLKTEHTYWHSYKTREEVERSLFDYIEMFYNAERRHSGIGNMSPRAFEKQRL